MRIPATIFFVTGLAYLAWNVELSIAKGVSLSTLTMGLVAAAFLYQAFSLFHAKPGSRLSGIISSCALTILFAGIALLVIAPALPSNLHALPADIWALVGLAALGGFAFTLSAVLLLRAKRAAP